ncbi:MAG: 3-phosphoshikimate 1-carboxyvinyltransferase [Chloroflexota bacterium]|nr:3-phosphoshikimate 1-carboxyvinyltransferase [Chloroflexota bacterium]NOG65357.1 3-phosphoshikimate 1-carboxyvinyltransferase [Chloroflexota bacterium]GIK66744.1 MAG: 3-phosphoshikimate 1-carboxyvinyltransferase [Chloroflexota bacterium]
MTTHNLTSTRVRVRPSQALRGVIRVPGDKSISHRALIFGALADGVSEIRGFLPAGDTLATLGCIRALGVQVDRHDDTTLTVYGRGLRGLRQPDQPLDCVNAGTGIRLLAGVMAGQPFPSVLDGSEQLRRRPMKRITEPLRLMGANVEENEGRAPLHFGGAYLKGITYEMPVASAQVKSCLLLAGLFADSPTTIVEPGPARDHTEGMLRAMGADIRKAGNRVTITPVERLHPLNWTIPADISSAAFPLVAGLLVDGAEVVIEGVGVNDTRTGILDALAMMGAVVHQSNVHEEGGEPVADLLVRSTPLHGTNIKGDLVVRMIDEFPILMVAALHANGITEVSEARELRVKETDRIAVMAAELRKLGAVIEEHPDGFVIEGPQRLQGAVVDGHDDHRVAMSLTIAGLLAEGETIVEDARCAHDSFPGFVETMQSLGAGVEWLPD